MQVPAARQELLYWLNSGEVVSDLMVCWTIANCAEQKSSKSVLIIGFTNTWMQRENPTLSICSEEGNVSKIKAQLILTTLGSFSGGSEGIPEFHSLFWRSVPLCQLRKNVLYSFHRTGLVFLVVFSPLNFNRGKLEFDSKASWQGQTEEPWTEVPPYTCACVW